MKQHENGFFPQIRKPSSLIRIREVKIIHVDSQGELPKIKKNKLNYLCKSFRTMRLKLRIGSLVRKDV